MVPDRGVGDCGGLAADQTRQFHADAARSLGFAQSLYFLSIFALCRPAAAIVQTALFALGFLAVWMGAATAHKVTGWRTLLLPVVVILIFVVGSAIANILLAGAQFTFESLLMEFGVP